MSFINGPMFLEYVIRVGFDDLVNSRDLMNQIFIHSDRVNEGDDLAPDGSEPFHDPLLMDEFQERLKQIPRRPGETGMTTIWRNFYITTDQVLEALNQANIKIIHGFPRTSEDLPCISLRIASESSEEYVGDAGGEFEVDQTGTHHIVVAEFDASYSITLATTNENELHIWYHVIKYALLRYRTVLEAYGLKMASQAWGDVEPASEYLQGGLFIYQRDCVVNCKKTEGFAVPKTGYGSIVGDGLNRNDVDEGVPLV